MCVCVCVQAILSIEDDSEQPEESVFCQVQSLLGHLMESKLQYYVPENFWKVWRYHPHLTLSSPSPHTLLTLFSPHPLLTTPSPHPHHTLSSPSPHPAVKLEISSCRMCRSLRVRVSFRSSRCGIKSCMCASSKMPMSSSPAWWTS